MYLDQSSNSADQSQKINTGIVDEDYRGKSENVDSDEDEDTSFRPRHFHEDGDCWTNLGIFVILIMLLNQQIREKRKRKSKMIIKERNTTHILMILLACHAPA